jgi:ribonuclease HI
MPPMPKRRKHVTVHTDGSCETQTGDGGWAYLLEYGARSAVASGFEAGTTNNRMELTAAVRALEALTEPCTVTDRHRQPVPEEGLHRRLARHVAAQRLAHRGRQSVKNRDLWERLLELTGTHEVTWSWTRGHAGHDANERVDGLALRARRERRGSVDA